MLRFIGLFLICLVGVCLADPEDLLTATPASPASTSPTVTFVTAKAQYGRALRDAQHAYNDATALARANYIQNLKGALDAALAVKDLDEVNRIDAEIKLATDQPDASEPQPKPPVSRQDLVSSLANSKWVGFGGFFGTGTLTLNADGTASNGTDAQLTWAAVSEEQIVLRWPSNDFDILTFSADRKTFVKDWLGKPAGQQRDRVKGTRAE